MGKTVQFKFPNSPTTRSTLSSSSSPSSYCSPSTNRFLSNNNTNSINKDNSDYNLNNNNKMFNGNNGNNYSKLPSTSKIIVTTNATTPTTTITTAIATTSTLGVLNLTPSNNYNTIYPSSALNYNENPTSSIQSRGRNIEQDENGIFRINPVDPNEESGQNDDERNNSRHNLISSSHTIDYDSMTEVVIEDLNETEPTSAILDYCKRKFLRLYLILLGLSGIYPTSSDTSYLKLCLTHLQTLVILALISFGYYLQYCLSFRRDRGFSVNNSVIITTVVSNPNYRDALDIGEILFVHVIPNALHLFGFLYAVYIFRMADNENLQNLVERVFLLTNRPKRLCAILWSHVLIGFIWLTMFTAYVCLLVYSQPKNVQLGLFFIPEIDIKSASWVRLALIITTFVQDTIQMTVLTAYCIECYLLRLHLRNLKEKLIQHTIETIDWMREILEFRKLLNHLNKKVSIPVCYFIVMNLSYGFAGLIYIFKEYNFDCPIKKFLLNFGNILLWLIIGMIPFFQAANLTRSCQSAQASGHQIRVRPFVYHTTSSSDLDSTLLFASSLNMSAKLFRMPIRVSYIFFSILIVSLIVIAFGMCLNISLGVL